MMAIILFISLQEQGTLTISGFCSTRKRRVVAIVGYSLSRKQCHVDES